MTSRRLALAAVAVAFAGTSCRGCGERGPVSVRELVGADAGAAFVVDSLGKLVSGAEGFAAKLTRKAGGSTLQQARTSIKAQFNLDPLDVKTYAAWGIDTDGGLAIFTEGKDPTPVLALAVSDGQKLDQQLTAMLAKADGASKLSEEKVGSFTVHNAGRPFGTEVAPAMHWVHVGRHVLIARAEGRAALGAVLDRLSKAAARPSLGSDPTFKELSGKLPPSDAVFFARPDASARLVAGGAAGLSRGAATGISLSTKGLDIDTFVSLAVPSLEKALAAPAPGDLASHVGEDAVIVALTRSLRPEAVAALRTQPVASQMLDKSLGRIRDEVGVDPEKDILPLLSGPLTLSVHLLSLDALASQVRQRQATVGGLLESIHVVITAGVKDTKGMAALLERSRQSLKERGVEVSKRTLKVGDGEAVVYTPESAAKAPPTAAPRLGWGLYKDTYVYAAGSGRLERELELLAGKGPSMEGKLGDVGQKLASEKGASVMVVRAAAVAERASGLTIDPAAAQGLDAIIGGVIELLRTLGDVGLAVTAEPEGLRLRLREQIQ
jgi:hypothetical protein